MGNLGIYLSLCLWCLWTVLGESRKECGLLPADFVFLFDASGSEGANGFKQQTQFMANFSSRFDVAANETQFAAVTFATSVKNNFFLNAYHTQPQLQNAIKGITWLNGETYTHSGLQAVTHNSLSVAHGARPGVQKYVIVLTDGQSNEPALTVKAANDLKKLPNVTVIAIGIGGRVDTNELLAIATDSKHVFTVGSFDLLHSVEKELTDTTCTLCGDWPADIAFLLDGSGSEAGANFQNQKDFVSLIVNEFNIAQNDTRIGVVQFATNARVEFTMDHYQDLNSVLRGIERIHWMNGETQTHLGLDLMESQMFSSRVHGHHHRLTLNPDRKKIAVVITDGRSTEPSLTISAANKLHKQGVEVFVVGIGSHVDVTELRNIATDSKHVITVKRSSQLVDVHNLLVKYICELRHPPPTTTPLPTTTPTTTTTVKPKCGPKPADILFVLDSSESEKEDNFAKEKTFVYNFIRRFQIGQDHVQFSTVTFSSAVRNDFWFNTYHTRSHLLRAVQQIQYMGAGTNTSEALKFVRENSFDKSHGARNNATHIVVVITDGQSSNPTETKQQATLLHQLKVPPKTGDPVSVFSIGIGTGVDQTELKAIASPGNTPLSVSSFDLLHTIQDSLENEACSNSHSS